MTDDAAYMALSAGLGETQAVAATITAALDSYAGTGLAAARATDQLICSILGCESFRIERCGIIRWHWEVSFKDSALAYGHALTRRRAWAAIRRVCRNR